MTTREDFMRILTELEDQEHNLLKGKGEEYTKDKDDRLSFFREAALECGTSMENICFILMFKHWRAISQRIKTGNIRSDESLRSRVSDLRNYSAFLVAIVEEKDESQR